MFKLLGSPQSNSDIRSLGEEPCIPVEMLGGRTRMRDDICGYCGEAGADKYAAPRQWPGERYPDSLLVHSLCEHDECERAFKAFRERVGQDGVDRYLREITR